MDGRQGVPLVRVETEEPLYDVEKVFGRDADDVFPTEAKKNMEDSVEGSVGSIGGLKFVTEKELIEIKKQRGDRPEDGTLEVNKCLAQVLAENKDAKEEAFQEIWKSMKEGKNRPLDEDEAEFLEKIAKDEWKYNRGVKEQEEQALIEFQLARAEMENAVKNVPQPAETMVSPEMLAPKRLIKRKPTTTLLRVKSVSKSASNKQQCIDSSSAAPITIGDQDDDDDDNASPSGGLLGLGDYGSGSDND